MQAVLLTMMLALGQAEEPPPDDEPRAGMPFGHKLSERAAALRLPRKRFPYGHLTAYPVSHWKHPALWLSRHTVRDLTMHPRPHDYRAVMDYPWYYRTVPGPYPLKETSGPLGPALPAYPDAELLPPSAVQPSP